MRVSINSKLYASLITCLALLSISCSDDEISTPTPPVEAEGSCGDGLLQEGEQCDDGNLVDDDGCSQTCEIEEGWRCSDEPSLCEPICGDGLIFGDEECDDDNLSPGDGCDQLCRVELGWYCAGTPSACHTRCGDALTAGLEQCDQGDENEDGPCDGCCREDCRLQTCGDGVVDIPAGELCDDGNLLTGDGCDQDCRVELGWECAGSPSVCQPICGDRLVVGNEQCDDGNLEVPDCAYGEQSCLVCSPECRWVSGRTSYCGNGLVDRSAGEECDDGHSNYDGPCNACCRTDCTRQACGDGVIDFPAGEQCDDGNTLDFDGCDSDCRFTGEDVVFASSRLWRPSWSEEFNGPEPGMEDCYDNDITPPQCLTLYWRVEDCPQEAWEGLADLNKCHWAVFYLYNWMDFNKPFGEGVNAFDPNQVRVQGGELIMTARPAPPPGGFPSGWTSSTSMDTIIQSYDCGNPPSSGHSMTTECPILSGGVWSKAMGPIVGLRQTYGRFDVRARLPVGRGSWPAHWMLPQEGPWPGAGEIDIMEATNPHPDEVAANFHDGVELAGPGGTTIRTHMSSGAMPVELTMAQQRDEYHVYSVEWESTELRFYLDNHHYGTVYQGVLARNKDLATGEVVGYYPLEIPDWDFHMILNSSITAFSRRDVPHPLDFPVQYHHVDYVRAWYECLSEDDYCIYGGDWDGERCLLGDLPARSDLSIVDSSLVYPAEAAEPFCPDGGIWDEEDWCLVYEMDPAARTYLEGGHFYAENACLESTLPSICRNPCQGVGRWDGYDCYLASVPAGRTAVVSNGVLVYDPLPPSETVRCPIGRLNGLVCEVGVVPPGRVAFIKDGRHFHLRMACDPTRSMPNCPEPCSRGGVYDGHGCHLFDPPAGSSPFIWENGFYYQPMSTDPETRCPSGSFDSANCFMGRAPVGAVALLIGGRFYLQAACGNVPRAWFHP